MQIIIGGIILLLVLYLLVEKTKPGQKLKKKVMERFKK